MTVHERRLGATSVQLSSISLGTMRFAEDGLTVRELADLLITAAHLGITSLHSSHEYASFELFCQALAMARKARPQWQPVHIVKLAEPGFGEDRFDADRFLATLDRYRSALEVDQVDVVQWMIRYDLSDHPGRVAILRRDATMIDEARGRADEAASMGALVAFPYHRSEIESALAAPWCDGVAVYLNPTEIPDHHLLDRCAAEALGVVGIRPLAAGRIMDEDATGRAVGWRTLAASAAEAALRFALLHPAVTTAVVSSSSVPHLTELTRAADQRPSASEFIRVAGPTSRA